METRNLKDIQVELDQLHELRLNLQKAGETKTERFKELQRQINNLRTQFQQAIREMPAPPPPPFNQRDGFRKPALTSV